jgi:hypothetical protein
MRPRCTRRFLLVGKGDWLTRNAEYTPVWQDDGAGALTVPPSLAALGRLADALQQRLARG